MSGWAFLVPYTAAYALYYWRQWPANIPTALQREHIPSLLTIYIGVHCIHIVAAGFALFSRAAVTVAALPPNPRKVSRANFASFASAVAPWALLFAIVLIPGVYLEWPSDPWEHLRRITEWYSHEPLRHSTVLKSTYFLAYSMSGLGPSSTAHMLAFPYYAAICGLLLYQYYRLAISCGLSSRFAFLATLLTMVTLGNSCFSYYRYYGISSAAVSQIASIAFMRNAVNYAKRIFNRNDSGLYSRCAAVARLFAVSVPLLLVIAFSHVQGLGICILALIAVIVCSLYRRDIRWLYFTCAIAIASSVFVIFAARSEHVALDQLVAERWLTSWYGFNMFAVDSPAALGGWRILGGFGAIGLALALVLAKRGEVIGWLTATPVVILCIPLVSVPLALVLSHYGHEGVLTFNRMLFGLAPGLVIARWIELRSKPTIACLGERSVMCRTRLIRKTTSILPATVLALAMISPPGHPWFNRVWNLLSITPDDLSLAVADRLAGPQSIVVARNTVGPAALIHMLNVMNPSAGVLDAWGFVPRRMGEPGRTPVNDFLFASKIQKRNPGVSTLCLPPTAFYTAYSQAAQFSHHWLPQEAALSAAAAQ